MTHQHTTTPLADGVEGSSADVFENAALIDQTRAAANRPVVTGIRRGPGGVAKAGLKAEWLVTLEDVCVAAAFRGRRLRDYDEFRAVIRHRYGITLAPMLQEEWSSIVEAAIAAGRSS